MALTFFGLSDEYIKNVNEQFFYLKYHGNWSFLEAYNLPIGLRNFYMNMLIKQKEMEASSFNDDSSEMLTSD